MRILLAFSVTFALVACAGPGGPISGDGSPAATRQAQEIQPDSFSLHPKQIVFNSPSAHFKYEYVHGFSQHGSIAENCISKGVAEVGGEGVHHGTLIAVVIPKAIGRCNATFTNGHGKELKLPVTVR